MSVQRPTPLISIVMPSLNQGEFIDQALHSIAQQGIEGLEVHVADGGSADRTCEALRRWQAHGPLTLSWTSAADRGPAHAVNLAISATRGAIIGWLNADDMYAPGAIQAALEVFSRNPDAWLVYGHGQFIDANGSPGERYPTLPPSAGADAFQGGCFICQPAAFVRREAISRIGPLDERLTTAFDFDFWLRIFCMEARRIAHQDQLFAYSRSHAATITARQRRQVALEGVSVLKRHLGYASENWLMTHIEESLTAYPDGTIGDLTCYVDEFLRSAEASTAQLARARIETDHRLRWIRPGLRVETTPDDWAAPFVVLRVVPKHCMGQTIVLRATDARPDFDPFEITVRCGWGPLWKKYIECPGEFEIRIPLGGAPNGLQSVVTIEALSCFVPNQVVPGATDNRRLGFRLIDAGTI